MIYLEQVKRYCREDPSLIENYKDAIASTERWHCHHRLELTLDGREALSIQDLKRYGMYYKRPAFELIFLKISDHTKLHHDARGHIWFGRTENRHSAEARKKIGIANTHRTLSAETRAKISKAHKGKIVAPVTEETKRKRSESIKAWWDAHPEAKKQRGESIKQNMSNPELRNRIIQGMKKAWILRKEKLNENTYNG